jgi:hypothetical protein
MASIGLPQTIFSKKNYFGDEQENNLLFRFKKETCCITTASELQMTSKLFLLFRYDCTIQLHQDRNLVGKHWIRI